MPRIPAKKVKPEPKPIEESTEPTPVAESSSVATTDPPTPIPETPPDPIPGPIPEPAPEPPRAKGPPPPASDLVADELQREQRLAEAREELALS